MRKTALAIRAVHPNIAYPSAGKSVVVEIAAARMADDGVHFETADFYIRQDSVDATELEKWDKGIDISRAVNEALPLDTVLTKLKRWIGSALDQKLYLFSKNEYIALTTLDKNNGNHKVEDFLKRYNYNIVQEELQYQFNIAMNKHCIAETVARSFARPLRFTGNEVTAEQNAINNLELAQLIPNRAMFDLYRPEMPLLLRYAEWSFLNNFRRDESLTWKVLIEDKACRVVVNVKCVYAGKKKAIARVTAVKRIDGNLLPLEIFDRYIVPTKFSMDKVDKMDEGLDRDTIENEGVLCETAFDELIQWIEKNHSALIYTWDERTLGDVQDNDLLFHTKYYMRIFGSIQQESIPIENMFIGCFSDGIITMQKCCNMLKIETPDMDSAFYAKDPIAQVRVSMSILLRAMNRRNGMDRIRERAEKEAALKQKKQEEEDAKRDPMDKNIAFYPKPILDRQGRTKVNIGTPANYLCSKKIRTFRCPECNREMVLKAWYLGDDPRREIPFGAVLEVEGETSCIDHGRFLCEARIHRDPYSGSLVGSANLCEYNDENYEKYIAFRTYWENYQRNLGMKNPAPPRAAV